MEKETGKKNKKLKRIAEFDQAISVEKIRNHEDGESESDLSVSFENINFQCKPEVKTLLYIPSA